MVKYIVVTFGVKIGYLKKFVKKFQTHTEQVEKILKGFCSNSNSFTSIATYFYLQISQVCAFSQKHMLESVCSAVIEVNY